MSSTPLVAYPISAEDKFENSLKEIHKKFVESVKKDPEKFIMLNARMKNFRKHGVKVVGTPPLS
jgi:hypothetical protein